MTTRIHKTLQIGFEFCLNYAKLDHMINRFAAFFQPFSLASSAFDLSKLVKDLNKLYLH